MSKDQSYMSSRRASVLIPNLIGSIFTKKFSDRIESVDLNVDSP